MSSAAAAAGPLAARLKAETATLHAAAERASLMAALLGQRLGRADYAALLSNLLALYAALEPALARHATHPAIAPLGVESLRRTPALRADLAGLVEADRTESLRPATERYVARIAELEAGRPGLLVAHAYVRYLGDLSGGQLLRAAVRRSAFLAGVGVAFYDFGDAGAVAALAQRFRAGLAATDAGDVDAVVAEAKLGFAWHRDLFDELASAGGERR